MTEGTERTRRLVVYCRGGLALSLKVRFEMGEDSEEVKADLQAGRW